VIALLLRAIREPHRRQVLVLLGAVVGVVLLGAGLFALAEGLPYTTGLYWAVTSATTVGYGDITPHNPIGRLIASLVMLTAIPLLAGAFAIVSGAAAQRDQERAPGAGARPGQGRVVHARADRRPGHRGGRPAAGSGGGRSA
jgi:drug/metabolite transporter (DMT)-like permease